MHPCIHAYVHTHVYPHIHASIHPYVYTSIRPSVPPSARPSSRPAVVLAARQSPRPAEPAARLPTGPFKSAGRRRSDHWTPGGAPSEARQVRDAGRREDPDGGLPGQGGSPDGGPVVQRPYSCCPETLYYLPGQPHLSGTGTLPGRLLRTLLTSKNNAKTRGTFRKRCPREN